MTQTAAPGLFDRLFSLRNLWRDNRSELPPIRPSLPDDDAADIRRHMQACLEGKGGEVTSRSRAASLGRAYLGLNQQGRERFLHILASEFATDREAVDTAIARVTAADSEEQRAKAEIELRNALQSPRLRLLTQFNALPEGVKFLVDLRAELLVLEKKDRALAGLSADLRNLLASWFDVGFLELTRITWRSPALILEKIMAYEAVHAIRSWQDLKNRLDSDRRLYAFFHPRMPDEPLIFVEVALVQGISDNIQSLLDETAPVLDPERADTAIFYSINNAQRGLDGISFGNFLIKRVVDDLRHEFPNLKTFATLSPIPRFRQWLLEKEPELSRDLDRPDWVHDAKLREALRPNLMRLCAQYLTERRDGGRVIDPVAHFHLSNGARIERLDWLGDLSPKGLRQSAGVMVNYLYKLSEIETNHEAYRGAGKISMSAGVKSLAKA